MHHLAYFESISRLIQELEIVIKVTLENGQREAKSSMALITDCEKDLKLTAIQQLLKIKKSLEDDMKKILLVTLSCAVLASSLFAKSNSLLGNIEKMANSLDKTEIKGVEGSLPEGKSLRGAVNLLLDIKPDEGDTKIKAILPELQSVDLLNDSYKVHMKVISKIAIGHSCEESWAAISKSENGFLVKIEKFKTYACNADGSSVGDIRDMSAKYFDKLAQ